MSTAQDLPPDVQLAEALTAGLRLVPGQPLDFEDAVRRVRPRLHRFAVRRLGDTHEAEELVQEALLRAYSHRSQFLTEDDLSAWSTVVTGRLVIDRLRVRGRSTSMAVVPDGARVGRDTADVVVARDEARTALDALDAMPPRQASLLWAREVEGLSYHQIGARFGMTEPAVRSVLSRARKALRKEYALRGGTLPVGGLAVLAPWVAGMTWAGKLRTMMSRVTAPSALAAIGVTTLGGLILSPFGPAPSPAIGSYAPRHAVVSQSQSQPLTVATSARRLAARGPSRTTSPAPAVRAARPTTRLPLQGQSDCASAAGVDVGSSHCVRPATSSRSGRIYLRQRLPDNPLGVRYVGVQSDLIDCSSLPVPTNPVIACSTQPSKAVT